MKQEFEPRGEAERKRRASAYELAVADVWSRRAELTYEERTLLDHGDEREIARRVLRRWRIWLWVALALFTPLTLVGLWNRVWVGVAIFSTTYLHPVLGYLWARRTYGALAIQADQSQTSPKASPTDPDDRSLREACTDLEEEFDQPVRYGDRELLRHGQSALVRKALRRRKRMRGLLYLPVGLSYLLSSLRDFREDPSLLFKVLAILLFVDLLRRLWQYWRCRQPSNSSTAPTP